MVGLNAKVHTNRRQIAADDFFLDLFESALDDGEIITKVSFLHAERAGYAKFPSPASRYAIVGVFIAVTGSSARCGNRRRELCFPPARHGTSARCRHVTILYLSPKR